jgi:hypothetical protein
MTFDELDRLQQMARDYTRQSESWTELLDAMPEAELWTLAGMMVEEHMMAPVVADYAGEVMRARCNDWERPQAAGALERWDELERFKQRQKALPPGRF